MANFRQIHITIWKDPWFLALHPPHKLLYIYLFSNERTSVSGLYEIAPAVINFETGLEQEHVDTGLAYFSDSEKIEYENDVMWVRNLRKYNATSSEKVKTRILADVQQVPDGIVKQHYIEHYKDDGIPYGYPMDTVSIRYPAAQNTVSIPYPAAENKVSIPYPYPIHKEKEKEKENDTTGVGGSFNGTEEQGIVFKAYEAEIGPLTPHIADEIGALLDSYSVAWIEEAIHIASENNKRKISYVSGVLRNWYIDGKDNGTPARPADVDAELRRKGYVT